MTPGLRKRTGVLVAAAGIQYVLVELVSAEIAVVFSSLTGASSAAGVGPAIVFATAAIASIKGGRLADLHGRRTVLCGGFTLAALGSIGIGVSIDTRSVAILVAGLIVAGAGIGALRLVKAAAADLYPGRRAMGIGVVQTGALVGALIGPAVAIAGTHKVSHDPLPWFLVAGGLMLGLVATAALLRPDPLAVAAGGPGIERTARPLKSILGERPYVTIILVAVCLVYGVMVMDMTLTGKALADHGEGAGVITAVLAVHFVGMFGPMSFAGRLAARYDRQRIAVGGAGAVLCGTLLFALVPVGAVSVASLLFVVGVGWCFAWVACLGEVMESAREDERGAVMGVADFGSDGLAGVVAVGGGALLAAGGIAGMASLGTAAAVVSAVALLWEPQVRARNTGRKLDGTVRSPG